MGQDLVIKTTARVQEASEPERHKPIIRIEDHNGRTHTLSHISDATELANTIRASFDSGRDNPFRPDGEIYRMTDPIVDFYKFCSNRSGTQTPTYADLKQAAEGGDGTKAKKTSDKKSKSSRLWKRREAPADEPQLRPIESSSQPAETETKKRSSWRKWFCRCCYCLCKNCAKTKTTTENNSNSNNINNGRLNENIDQYNTATAGQAAKSQDLIITSNQAQRAPSDKSRLRQTDENSTTNWDSNSPAAIKTHNNNSSEAPQATASLKQTKVVIVDEQMSEAVHNIAQSNPHELSTNNNNELKTNGQAGASSSQQRTAPKATTSKCVVS